MARTTKLVVKFCQTQTHMIPMTKDDRRVLVERGLTATRIPTPSFAWAKANFFKDLTVETHSVASVLYNLTSQFIQHLPDGVAAKPLGPLTKAPLDTVFLFVEDGSDVTSFNQLVANYKHYLHRYCFTLVEQVQKKEGGELHRLLIEESLDLPNGHYFNDATGPSTVANLDLSSYFRLNWALEQTATHSVLAVRMQDKVGDQWQTNVHRAFHKDMVDKQSVRDLVDFLMANFL